MITLGISTSRPKPAFDWMFDSLCHCSGREMVTQIVIVDLYAEPFDEWTEADVANRRSEVLYCASKFTKLHNCEVDWIPPKPNVWSGKFRITPVNWWSKPESLNSIVCKAKSDYLVFSDDRCVFKNTFLDAVKEAKEGNYAVCGTYQKRTNMVVHDGRIVGEGEIIGNDSRASVAKGRKMICPGTWMFGHAFGLPLEWMLQINGIPELANSASMEDTIFGMMVENNGYPIYHDPRMAQIQCRTPGICEHNIRRSSKEKHPNDKNDKLHTLLRTEAKLKRATNMSDLREMRKSVLAGRPFPIPLQPTHDWFDNQPLSEFV